MTIGEAIIAGSIGVFSVIRATRDFVEAVTCVATAVSLMPPDISQSLPDEPRREASARVALHVRLASCR